MQLLNTTPLKHRMKSGERGTVKAVALNPCLMTRAVTRWGLSLQDDAAPARAAPEEAVQALSADVVKQMGWAAEAW